MMISNRHPEFIKIIKRAYMNNPVYFFFPFYASIYYPEFTEVFIDVVGNDAVGYLLIWKGACPSMHLVGNIRRLINEVSINKCADVRIIPSDYEIRNVLSALQRLSGSLININRILTMICARNAVKEYTMDGIRRLNLNDLDDLISIEEERGTNVNRVEIFMRLVSPHWHYYGAFVNNELVSIATTSAKLPEIWYISDVYTRQKFRGLNYAKAVVSAVTRDAINSGAIAMLQVPEDNTAAIRAYKDVGYIAINIEYLAMLRD